MNQKKDGRPPLCHLDEAVNADEGIDNPSCFFTAAATTPFSTTTGVPDPVAGPALIIASRKRAQQTQFSSHDSDVSCYQPC